MRRTRWTAFFLVPAFLLSAWVLVVAQDAFLKGFVTGGGTVSTDPVYQIRAAVGESFHGGGAVRPGYAETLASVRARSVEPGSPDNGRGGALVGVVQGNSVSLTFTLLDGSLARLSLTVLSDGKSLNGTGLLPMGDVLLSMTRSIGSADDLTGTYMVDFGGEDLIFVITQTGLQLTGYGEPKASGPEPSPSALLMASGTFDGSVVTLSAMVEGRPITLTLALSDDGTQLIGSAATPFGDLPFTFTLRTRTGSDPLDGIWEGFDEGELVTLDLDQLGSMVVTRDPGAMPRLSAPIALELGFLLYLFEEGVDRNADGNVDVNDFALSLGALGGAAEPASGSGRVRVTLPPLSTDEPSLWTRLAKSYGGEDQSSFFLPEVEDEVLVAFLSGDPGFNVLLGQQYSGTDAPAATDAGDGRTVARGKVESFDPSTNSFMLKDLAGATDDVRVMIGEAATILSADLSADAFAAGNQWRVVDGAYWESLTFKSDTFNRVLEGTSLADCDFVVLIGARGASEIRADGLVGIRAISTVPTPDFDGDGEVGFSDFISFAGVFGKFRGDDGFESKFDLDGDGEIGFGDFITFAQAFGTRT